MRISIVTISFNQKEFLERTIRSVIEQEGVELEYIVQDPGSTDGSRELIQQYADRISHVSLQPDKGAADGLNKGFSLATGDIYGYLNSDDTFCPNALIKVANYFRDNPNIDVVSGHAYAIGRHDNRLRKIWSDPMCLRTMAYGGCVLVQPSTFMRRDAFIRSGGFNVDNRVAWDGELIVDLAMTGAKFGRVSEFLSNYRLHGDSITNSGKAIAAMNDYNLTRFKRIMGRHLTSTDIFVARLYRIRKRLMQPRATWERITRGVMFQRGAE